MKGGYTLKSASIMPGELEAISSFARRSLSENEIYVFSVVLCDNEIDRDGERFTLPALKSLSELFIGKTGIFDHSMRGKDQTARIFSARVEKVDGMKNSCGEPYYQLIARAYMPKLPKNADLIQEIEMGIKKEVSVGCSIRKMLCSICGADIRHNSCGHKKGGVYISGGQEVICHTLLDEPDDAYEWSFVAVPAQPRAGVTKSYNNQREVFDLQGILKQLQMHEELTLHAEECQLLHKHIEQLEMEAAQGRAYRKSLTNDIVRLSAMADPALDRNIMGTLIEKMSIEEMEAFKSYFETKVKSVMPVQPQLNQRQGNRESQEYKDFRI